MQGPDRLDRAALDALVPRLRRSVRGEVETDRSARARYSSDASSYRVLPAAVVAPASVEDLAAVVALAAGAGVPLTMRGAGTSIAGNAIGPGLVVDTSRHLRRIVDLDPAARTVTVLPGTVLDDVNVAAARHGLRVGPDPSTHDRATIGGMVGNNACGAHSVRWGTTAENVLALELITAGGTSLRADAPGPALDARLRAFVGRHTDLLRAELPPWPRRVSGYALDWLLPERGFDVARALTGSEGTCVVVGSATLRLVEVPRVRGLLLLPFADDVEAAAAVQPLLDEAPLTVESMTPGLLRAGEHPPSLPPGGAWLLVEAAGDDAPAMRDHAARLAAALGRRVGGTDAVLVEDAREQAALWHVREDGAGRSARLPDGSPAWPGFEDAAVPPANLARYLAALHGLLRGSDLRGITYGHFGEGCIHLRVGFGLDRPGGEARLRGFMEQAAGLVVAHGGSISGEHGDGRARSELLDRQFSPAMMEAFREWKAIWDPRGLLNPGVMVAPASLTADLRRTRPTLLARPAPGFAFAHDSGDLRAATERCIGVGRCVSTLGHAAMCPSYRATGDERHSTRGRARLLQEMAAGSLADEGWRSPEVLEALDLCLSCRACASECPTGVDMASYKAEVLHQRYRGRLRPRSHYLLGRLPRWLVVARRVPGGPALVNAVTSFTPTRRLVALIGGLAGERRIPRLASRTFRDGFRHPVPSAPHRGQVLLWPDTFTNHLAPGVGDAAVRVLAAAGYDVALPGGDVCCGLTRVSTGQLDGAKAVLRRTLDAAGVGDGWDPIVVLEPSCATTLRRDLPELLPDDPRAAAVAGRVRTLAEVLDVAGWAAPGGEPVTALVQPHCHQQAVLGTGADGRVMAASGIDAATVLAGCCGLAGNFGAEAGHEKISRRVAELELLPALRAAAQDTEILADGFSCRTQIAFLDGRRARHLAEVLAARLPVERDVVDGR
ncbi:MAG TPA: FAD-binding and (Fe-S)-binding domain-containing protein [Candidatus Limnocylindrales bacterium]|nr:FAD-binding and (Fe-S)-binding domain-containing protein [Candidatus Limnocylindrales bacterium]